jgi:hypothetical protein
MMEGAWGQNIFAVYHHPVNNVQNGIPPPQEGSQEVGPLSEVECFFHFLSEPPNLKLLHQNVPCTDLRAKPMAGCPDRGKDVSLDVDRDIAG